MDAERREFLRWAGRLGAAAAAAGGLGEAAAPRPVTAQTTSKRELVVAQSGDLSKFDPHFSTSSNDIRITFNLFDNEDYGLQRHVEITPNPNQRFEVRRFNLRLRRPA